MIAIALLAAVIGVIVYSSRRARADYVVSVKSEKPGETWTFDVRDMTGELRAASTGEVLESFDLRRDDDGRWESAARDSASSEPRPWTPCDEALLEVIEEKYRRYNGRTG